ncbi:dihydrodipicolinate synthase family protein [Maribacter antarcticus]|uniref:dihydrodipicolinate synthase family protein n=1 Tax=Maribacter antarcticus TaxID=505250 RepID=UPI000684E97D|nr:dihydrodipicolinate synthase family protein [Maribacter antarcticus]
MKKKLCALQGIVTVLNTPFTSNDKIDMAALRNHVKEAINAGVSGFLVPAMAAEVYKLSEVERMDMVATVLETVAGRVPVIAGAGETDLLKSKKLLKGYIGLGCENVLFQIPFENEKQFRKHFMELAELEPEMIMLQDWDATGYGLLDELICDLFTNVEAFRCLKIESVPAGIKYSRILELTEGRLNISGGWAVTQMLEGLRRGVHAFMPTGMHYSYTSIYNYYVNGNFEEAEKLFAQILPILAFSNQHLDISIHFFKRLLYRQGIYPTANVRKPSLPFDFIHQEIAERHIDTIMEIEANLKSSMNQQCSPRTDTGIKISNPC